MTRSFGRAVLRAGIGQGLAGVLRLALPIAAARLLAPGDFGIFSVLTVFSLIAFSLGNLGLFPATTFYVARREWPAGTTAFNALLFSLVLGIGAALAGGGVVALSGRDLVGGAAAESVVWALAALPGLFVVHATLAVFLGLEHYRGYNGLAIGLHLLVLVFTVAALWRSPDGATAVVAWSLGSLVVAAVAVVASWPIWREHARAVPGLWRRLAGFGVRSHASGVITFLNYRIDILLVGALLGTREAGLYAAVVALGETVWFFSQVTGQILFTRVAGDLEGRRTARLTPVASRLVLVATGGVAVLLALAAAPLVSTVYSDEYLAAVGAFRILLIGVVTLSVSRILAYFVAAIGSPERNVAGSLLGLVANVVLNLWLIPVMGITGAAVASAVSYTLTLAHRLWAYVRISPRSSVLECLIPRPGDAGEILRSLRRP